MTAVIPAVLAQHAEDSALLWSSRQTMVRCGHVELRRLARLDNRVAAHLDGCVVGRADAIIQLLSGLVDPRPSTIFALTAAALESSDQAALDHALTAAEALPATFAGLASAFGWVDRDRLAGIVRNLLVSESPFRRRLGLASCRLHGVDPGAALVSALDDTNPGVRAEALRGVGSLGLDALLPQCTKAMRDEDPECAFWAAWSATIVGERAARNALARIALVPGMHRARAFRLALQTMNVKEGHDFLQQVAPEASELRRTIIGSGINGDPGYVPWLISHCSDDNLARTAGEAFTLITGTGLALDLERKPPENFESGPNDDPDDPNVDMDPDDGLPWPDAKKVEAWWHVNEHRFQKGTRYFMGQPVTKEHCIHVLKTGYQRQRILAAHYLCLLEPGTPLFNTSAPAWRQQKLLASM